MVDGISIFMAKRVYSSPKRQRGNVDSATEQIDQKDKDASKCENTERLEDDESYLMEKKSNVCSLESLTSFFESDSF